MNFGTLKDIFLENLIESYSSENDKGKELYKKFLNLIKENEVLKTAFIVFKNIETKTIVSEASAINYLNECKNLFDLFRGDKSLPKNLEKLTRIFFMHRRKMLKKSYNLLFNGNLDIANKLNIDLSLRPQNLNFETYYKLSEEYESLRS